MGDDTCGHIGAAGGGSAGAPLPHIPTGAEGGEPSHAAVAGSSPYKGEAGGGASVGGIAWKVEQARRRCP